MQIPIARPQIGDEEIEAVSAVLSSGMLAQGAEVAAFEKEFAAYCGSGYAVAVNSGTAALHAALVAIGITAGEEVIVPSFSFIATATAVSMCGATPVFADVDDATFTIDPESAGVLVTPRTRAVIGVHLFGHPFDVLAIGEICEDHNLLLVEDAAQAHGAAYHGKMTGSMGDVGCFSFYPTKNMTTGEGGMITTDHEEVAERVRRIINHGQSGKYLHTELGYNYRLTNIGAAIGRVQLRKLERFNERRIENARFYSSRLTAPGLHLPAAGTGIRHVYHQYVIRVEEGFTGSRDGLAAALAERGIGTAVHYPLPLHRQPIYVKEGRGDPCPVASELARSVLSLPVHPGVGENELEYICRVIEEFL